MTQTYQCPTCGQETPGAYSEGGLRWALCEDCVEDSREYDHEKQFGAMCMRQLGDGNRGALS